MQCVIIIPVDFINFILHFDSYLADAIGQLGVGAYLLLFLIVFAETGLVIMPFLPGDSLLFAAGALAGTGLMNIWVVIGSLLAAAILGDTVNYWVGSRVGSKVFARQNARLFKPSHLEKTQAFYAKHGGKTIILARFVPIVRTFAPFVAGVGKMPYGQFLAYNVIGALVWVIGLTLVGFFFGRLPFVKDNFEIAVLAVIALSILPGIFELIRHKRKSKAAANLSYQEIKAAVNKD